MEIHSETAVVVILLSGLLAQWLAWRLKVPGIVLLTIAGVLLGPVSGIIVPARDFGEGLSTFVQLSVAIILFEGGLNLRFHELGEAQTGVRRLVVLGLPFSFLMGTLAAAKIGGLSWPSALLFGAIIVVTGPTVILPLLRQARLKARPSALLKWEGIVNDPLGALLAVAVFEYFTVAHGGQSDIALLAGFALSLLATGVLGWVVGGVLARTYRAGLVPEFLKGPVMLAVVLASFVAGNALLPEAGLLTVTVLGMTLGNARLPSIEELRRFKEALTILLVSSLFIVLTADLDPALLQRLGWRDTALLAAVVLLVRPVSVGCATIRAGLTWQERMLCGWIGPRGIVAAAVAGAFSARMVEAGYSDAERLLPLIFALILLTVVLHGFSLGWCARALGLASRRANGLVIVGASAWSVDFAQRLQELEVPVVIVDGSWHRLRAARFASVPTFFGPAIAEASAADLDLSSMGHVLAATDNDAYNALVCLRFAHEFNRSAVYQLPLPKAAADERQEMPPVFRGRPIFADEAVYELLQQRYFEGWRFQRTRLTEAYDYERYRNDKGTVDLAAVVVRAGGTLELDLQRYRPGPGDTVLNFLPRSETSDR